jgi:putative ABC transport system ATP-binding protein
MRTILQAENLTKVYRVGSVDVPALRGVSLEVEEGEYLAIMGPSGCGKSTMLHLLGALLTPTTGRIIIDDEDLTAATDAKRTDIRRRKIGFVFQRFNLFPTLSAEGNLKLAESIHGGADGKKGGDPERRREILRMLQLEDKMHHKPLELSGGLWSSSGSRSRAPSSTAPPSSSPTSPPETWTPKIRPSCLTCSRR